MTACELLAPAGSLEKLKIAIHYGADAVYFGGKQFSLRAKAGNLSHAEIEEAVKYARECRVKTYVTLNVFARDSDLPGIRDYLEFLRAVSPDAIIVSDLGVLTLAKKIAPEIPIHLSTQASTTNYESALFYQSTGLKRINLARELGLEEIRQIRQKTSIELEVFIHGALCISYSGRCMLSLYLAGRDANRGNCAHPCRYSYRLQEEKRPGEFFPVEEDSRGLYIFNSRDLCLARRIPELLEAGVDSLKIEGRMKGIFYLATAVRAYRAALDAALGKGADHFGPKMDSELSLISSRGFTENFFDGPPGREDMLYEGPTVRQLFIPAAVVVKGGEEPLLRVNYVIRPGDKLEYMNRDMTETLFRVMTVYDAYNNLRMEKALGGQNVRIDTEPAVTFEPYALIRKKNRN